MRTLEIIRHISLDGVIQTSGGDGGFPAGRVRHHGPGQA